MKKLICLFLVAILVISVVLYAKYRKDALFAEEIQTLQEEHPQYFGLDTSEGLNILVFRVDKTGNWIVRLVPGNKDFYSIYEGVGASLYEPLSLDEAKKILAYYDLPDNMVILRPYDNPVVSGYTLAMLMDDERFLIEMAEAFDNRYRIGEIFEVRFDAEIDGLPGPWDSP